jgi:hypothetical protein
LAQIIGELKPIDFSKFFKISNWNKGLYSSPAYSFEKSKFSKCTFVILILRNRLLDGLLLDWVKVSFSFVTSRPFKPAFWSLACRSCSSGIIWPCHSCLISKHDKRAQREFKYTLIGIDGQYYIIVKKDMNTILLMS